MSDCAGLLAARAVAAAERARAGNLDKEADKLARQSKLFVRDRLGAAARRRFVRRGRAAGQHDRPTDLPPTAW